ncbi:MAG TPA: hypothetical protein VF179_31865, partial [Thermoanaerobaculia bacterium]|nr:hypothetical protein [Thermoanaerobaculia bacterium]
MTRSSRLFLVVLLLAFVAGLTPARAELVVLTDGRFLKVKSYEVAGEQAKLYLPYGGRMTLPIDRVERIVDDEYVPPPLPDPVAVVIAEAAPAGPIPLRFEESQPVPEGPYGTLIYETAKRHQVNPTVVAALIR